MDQNKIAELFTLTLDHTRREEAEKQLDSVRKIIGFYPSVLQIAMNPGLNPAVRQSAAVYLKNACSREWEEPDEDRTKPGLPVPFSIHENDKVLIRESIVDAVVLAPDTVSSSLVVCVNSIAKQDFPDKWPSIVEKIGLYLQHPEKTSWKNVLIALFQLIRVFEYKQADDRRPLEEVLKVLLPLMYQRCCELMSDDSDDSLRIQKQILKNIYTTLHYHLSLKLFTRDILLQWMEIIKTVIERPVPARLDQVDDDERPDEPAWKCKKWALNIAYRIFERYGTPASVGKEYKLFADWFMKTFSAGIITALLKILDQYGNKIYVTPRVMYITLSYLSTAVQAAVTWKLLKQHINLIIQNIVFPLLCHTKDDQELWEDDPQEYIRVKFDVFEDAVSPVVAAQTLMHTTCKKRKGMLEKTLAYVVQILSNPASDPTMKDGALHMAGAVAEIVLKKDNFKDMMEVWITSYVFPHFESPHGFLRARACWVMQYFSDIEFKNEQNVLQVTELVAKCLMQDNDLPVKVEAAICFQNLVNSQARAKALAEPNIATVALEILEVIRKTENEDMTTVMQKLVCLYSEQLVPVAYDLILKLAQTFEQLIDAEATSDGDDKSLMAMSVLNTIDTILSMMDEQPEVMSKVEPIVVNIIVKVLQNTLVDLYEEAINLVVTLTSIQVSSDLWKIFEILYQVFTGDGVDYFTEMAPALHNYITVDPPAFISNQNHVLAVYNMCKTVIMSGDDTDEGESLAAKLLEVVILQFPGAIDTCISPFVELALTRLTKPDCCDDMTTMCLHVGVAALYYNPDLFFQTLLKLQPADLSQPLFDHFMKQWLENIPSIRGIHDRKLSVLGLATLMSLPPNRRPPSLNGMLKDILPSALLLFEALKETYAARAKADAESRDDSDEEDYDSASDPEDLGDDDDAVTAAMDDGEKDDDDDDDEDDYEDEEDDFEETLLESYTTVLDAHHISPKPGDGSTTSPIDEFITFRQVLESKQREETDWFNALMSPLTPEQQKTLQDVFNSAEQRRAVEASKAIEKQGGYNFSNASVPTSFNFGGKPA